MKKIIFFVLLVSVFLVSCGKKSDSNKNTLNTVAPEISTYMVNTNAYGQVVQCPVDVMDFKISKDTKAVKYNDKVHYFCCPDCEVKFRNEPDKYSLDSRIK